MRRGKSYYALETRVLLDAAAVATAVEASDSQAASESSAAKANEPSTNDIASALADASTPQRTNEIAFIDGSIEGAEQLAENLSQTMDVVIIDPNADGVSQITQALDGRDNLSGIHIFSHGSAGQLSIGNSNLTLDSLQATHGESVSQWSNALGEHADILIYGCDLAYGAEGQAFVDAFAELTQADIAASTDITGSSALGGNWLLESEIGLVETDVVALVGFEGILTNAPTIVDVGETRQVAEDSSIAINDVTVEDIDANETLSITIRVTDNSGSPDSGDLTGTLTLASTTNLSNISGNGTGVLTFEGTQTDINNALAGMTLTPSDDLNGDVRVAIGVDDGDQSNTLNVSVSVTAVNDAPTLSTVPATVAEGSTVNFSTTEFGLDDADITSGDQEAQQMIVQINSLPGNGNLTFNGSPAGVGSVFSYDQVAQLSYTHDGSDVVTGDSVSFNVTVNDGAGGSTTGTITINLTPVNTAPTISGSPTIFESQPNVSVGLNIVDEESGHADAPANSTVEIVSTDLNGEGTLYLDLNDNDVIDAGEVLSSGSTFSADNIGLVEFSHNGNETNTSDAPSFVVRVTDAGGGEGGGNELSSADTTITLTITPVNDNPVLETNAPLAVAAQNGANTIESITATQLDVSDVDSADNNLVYTLETRPAYGVVEVQVGADWFTLGIGGRFTQAQIDAGDVRYIHEVTTSGNQTDTFTFTVRDSALVAYPNAGEEGAVRDGNGDIQLNTFTINITGAGGTQLNPSDPSPGYGGTSGSVNDNSVSPEASQTMTDTNDAIVSINEGDNGLITSDMISYSIRSADDSYIVAANETVYTLTSLPPNGSIQLDTTGSGNWQSLPAFGNFTQDDVNNNRVRFVHDGGEDFISTFNYRVSDGGPNSLSSTFTLDVEPINDAPVANGATVLVSESSPGINDGTVRLTSAHVGISDADLAEEGVKQVGEGVQDPLWFRVSSLPSDGALERWDGSAWVSVATSEWLPADLITSTADGATSGLRYIHGGGDQAANLTDSFQFEVRDDLSGASSANEVRTGQSTPTGTNVSNTATVNMSVIPSNDVPIVPVNEAAADTTVTDINGNSDTTVNNVLTVGEGGTETITSGSHLNAVDTDNNSVQRQFRITDAVSNGTLFNNGQIVGVGSSFTQADIDNGLITYTHDGSETLTDSFNFVVSDGVGTSAVSTFSIEVTPSNDIATLTTPSTVQFFTSSAYNFTNTIVIDDSDLASISAGETDSLTVTIELTDGGSTVTDSTITLGSTSGITVTSGTNNAAGGILVFNGGLSDIQAALTNLELQVANDEDAELSLNITVDDRVYSGGTPTTTANGGTTNEDGSSVNSANNTVTNSIIVQTSNTNDAPTITNNPASITVNEDTSVNFTGGNQIQINDVDAFDADVTVTLSVAEGDLSLSDTSLITSGSNGSANVTLTGTVDEINAALLGLSYQGDEHYNGSDTLNITVNDGSNSGEGAAGSDSESVAITVTPVNDAPVISLPSTQDFVSGTSFTFSDANGNAITITDTNDSSANNYTDNVQVTLSIDDGTLTLAQTTNLSFTNGDGSSDASMTFSGTVSDINDALDGLSYTPSNTNSDTETTLSVAVDDLANGGTNAGGVGGSLTDSGTVVINTSTNNDAPVVTVPSNSISVNEDASVVLTGAGNVFTINDPDDFGADNLVATITATQGTLSLASDDGTQVSGSGTTQLTLTGTEQQINNALDGLTFTPDTHFHGDAQITVAINDAGNTGAGGAQSDSDSITVTVDPINDRPTATGIATLGAVVEDTSNPIGAVISSLITASHYSDATDDQSANSGGNTATNVSYIAITNNDSVSAQGSWQVSDGAGGWISIPTGGLSESNAFIVAADQTLRFVPAVDFHGTPGELTLRLADNSTAISTSTNASDLKDLASEGGTGPTGAWSAGTASVATSVTNVNDQPVNSNATLASVAEDSANPAGDTVTSLFSGAFNDNRDDQSGISGGNDSSTNLGGAAIVGNNALASQGEWQYNNSGSWVAIPTTGLSDSAAIILPNDASLRFVPNGDFNGTPGDLTIRLADSVQTFSNSSDISSAVGSTDTWSNAGILNTSINPVNDAPILSGTASNPTAVENSGASTGSSSVTLIQSGTAGVSDVDGDPASFGGGSITVSFTNGYQSGDTLSVAGNPAGIDTVSGGSGADLVINLSAAATEANIDAILEAITYNSTSDNPTNFGNDTTRNYEITLNDGNNNGSAGGPNSLDSSNTLTGTLTITATNDAPVGTTIPTQTNADNSTASVDVSGYFSDVDNNSGITYSATGLPPGLSINTSTGVITGTIDNSASTGSAYTVTVEADDNSGGTTSESFVWNITNPAPTATANANDINEDSVSSNGNVITDNDGSGIDSDPDGDDLTVSAVNGVSGNVDNALNGTYGEITVEADGDYTYVLDNNNTAVQALAVGESLSDSFSYTVSDGEGGSSTATIAITINGTNDQPSVVVDTASTNEDTAINIDQANGVLANDSDTDSTDNLSVTQIGNGSTTVTAANPISGTNGGSFTINSDGSYNFTPGADFNDLAAGDSRDTSVTYFVTDGNGGTNSTTLTITVNGVNDAPVANTIPTQNGSDSQTINFDASTFFSDPDNNSSLSYTASGLPPGLSINNGGVITGTIDNDASQSGPYTVTVTANDGNSGSVDANFTWLVGNLAPNATIDTDTVDEDTNTSTSGNVITGDNGNGADSDPDNDALTVTAVNGNPANIGNTINGSYGDIIIDSNGSYSFDLNNNLAAVQNLAAGEFLTDTVNYTIGDGEGGSSTATLTITINGTNDVPVATVDTATTNEDTLINVAANSGVLSNDNDTDGSDTLRVLQITNNAATVTAGNIIQGSDGGLFTINSDGSYRFDPALDFQNLLAGESQTTSVTYTVTDDNGGTFDTTLTITVNGVDDLPEGTAIANQSSNDNDSVNIDFSEYFSDADGDNTLSYTAVGLPPGLTINSAGVVSGITEPSASVGQMYTVTITAEDNTGNTVDTEFTWFLNNVDPVATDNEVNVTEDAALTARGNVITDNSGEGADFDPENDAISIQSINGITPGNSVVGSYGTLTFDESGNYSYQLNNNNSAVQALAQNETLVDEFTYILQDSDGGQATATLNVVVNGQNESLISDDGPSDKGPVDAPINTTSDSTGVTVSSGSNSSGSSSTGASASASSLSPGLSQAQQAFGSLVNSENVSSESLNPISLSIALEDRVIQPQGIQEISLPSNAFKHSDPSETIKVTVSLSDGSDLPSYIKFNAETMSFEVDANAALQTGKDTIIIRVTGEDSQGNSASSVFTIMLQDTESAKTVPADSSDNAEIPETEDTDDTENENKSADESNSDLGRVNPEAWSIVSNDSDNIQEHYQDIDAQLAYAGKLYEHEQEQTALLNDIKTLFS